METLSMDELFESRLGICKGCDKYNAEAFDGGGQCMACGCPIQTKLRVKPVGCPLGKWEAVQSGPNGSGFLGNTPERPAVPLPSVLKYGRFSSYEAMKEHLASLPRTSRECLRERQDICNACEHYDPNVGGTCSHLGRQMQVKTRMARVTCPLGKWGADMAAETPPPAQPVAAPVPEYVPPTITGMAKSFFSSAAQFVAAGMPRTPLEQLQVRLDTCRACQYWNPEGFGGTGSCRQCGCSTEVKLRMATSECPMGYWQAVPAHSEG